MGKTAEYHHWKYEYTKKGEFIEFKVIPDKIIEQPSSFFKYYALTENSVDALTNLYVYATHPAQLNDPFDCDMQLAKIEDEESAKVLLDPFYEDVRQMFGTNKEQFFKYSTDCFSTLVFQKYGVLSLTNSEHNMVMWSLYAQNTGFCLERDVSKLPFTTKGPFPIHYVDKITPASSKEYDVPLLVLIQSNVKRNWWKEENEWRLLIQSPAGFDMKTIGKNASYFERFPDHDRKFKYPIRALKGITLGCQFFANPSERQQIILDPNYELHVCYQQECLQTRVLDFLDKIKDFPPVQVKYMFKQDLEYSLKKIAVTKISPLTYRITELTYNNN